MNTVLLGNIVALIGAAIMVSTGFLKTKKQILTVQCFQYGVLSASNAILGAFTGITANIIGIVRNLFCMKKEFTTPWKIAFIAAQHALLPGFAVADISTITETGMQSLGRTAVAFCPQPFQSGEYEALYGSDFL